MFYELHFPQINSRCTIDSRGEIYNTIDFSSKYYTHVTLCPELLSNLKFLLALKSNNVFFFFYEGSNKTKYLPHHRASGIYNCVQ